jgi:zinc transport system substrate-binding protein
MKILQTGACLLAFLATALLPNARGATNAPFRILTSFHPMYIHTLNIAGNIPGVDISNLTRPATGCLHDYQATPDDVARLTTADAVIINGGGMEAFLDKTLQGEHRPAVINASEGIEWIRDEHGINPHAWTSPSLAIRQVENIARQLAAADPAHAGLYQRQAQNYVTQLEALRDRMRAGLQSVRVRDLVTFHEAFVYFAREFTFTPVAVITADGGAIPRPRELARTVNLIKARHIPAIFVEPQYASDAALTIARETGATVYTLDPGVTGPDRADAYLRMMETNLLELQRALK